MAVVLDEGGAQALHDDLSAAVGPPIVPVGELPVDDLPEGAEGDLAFGGPAHDVRMGAHEAVGDDLDAELLFVFSEECEELLAGGVGVEDETEAVAPPGAVVGGVHLDEVAARNPGHGEPARARCAPGWRPTMSGTSPGTSPSSSRKAAAPHRSAGRRPCPAPSPHVRHPSPSPPAGR